MKPHRPFVRFLRIATWVMIIALAVVVVLYCAAFAVTLALLLVLGPIGPGGP